MRRDWLSGYQKKQVSINSWMTSTTTSFLLTPDDLHFIQFNSCPHTGNRQHAASSSGLRNANLAKITTNHCLSLDQCPPHLDIRGSTGLHTRGSGCQQQDRRGDWYRRREPRHQRLSCWSLRRERFYLKQSLSIRLFPSFLPSSLSPRSVRKWRAESSSAQGKQGPRPDGLQW